MLILFNMTEEITNFYPLTKIITAIEKYGQSPLDKRLKLIFILMNIDEKKEIFSCLWEEKCIKTRCLIHGSADMSTRDALRRSEIVFT